MVELKIANVVPLKPAVIHASLLEVFQVYFLFWPLEHLVFRVMLVTHI